MAASTNLFVCLLNDHIFWFYVPMHYLYRVEVGHCTGNITQDVQNIFFGNTTAIDGFVEYLTKITSIAVFHAENRCIMA